MSWTQVTPSLLKTSSVNSSAINRSPFRRRDAIRMKTRNAGSLIRKQRGGVSQNMPTIQPRKSTRRVADAEPRGQCVAGYAHHQMQQVDIVSAVCVSITFA